MRLTPAYAGNIDKVLLYMTGLGAHPRIRGEYGFAIKDWDWHRGSPPHTRGILICGSRYGCRSRLTPAYAGNMPGVFLRSTTVKAHPRIRGEYIGNTTAGYANQGSPPHTRGIFMFRCNTPSSAGLTPAYAGNIVVIKPFSASSK